MPTIAQQRRRPCVFYRRPSQTPSAAPPRSQGLAAGEHTALLLSCYAKLRAADKLDAFAARAAAAAAAGAPAAFDAAAAAAALRAAGYPEHALAVARAAGDADAALGALLEDLGRGDEALALARSLGRRGAAAALRRRGRALLAAAPEATTALLMELCLPAAPEGGAVVVGNGAISGNGASLSAAAAASAAEEARRDAAFVADLADFAHLYADRPAELRYACEAILGLGPPAGLPSRRALHHALLDIYLGGTSGSGDGTGSGPTSTAGANGAGAAAAATGRAGRADALELLRRGWVAGAEPAFDPARALAVCRLHGFAAGLAFLYSRLGRDREAGAALAGAAAWPALLELCAARGAAEPALWRDALEALAGAAGADGGGGGDAARAAAEAALRALLDAVEAAGALPPLAVLPALAARPRLRLELVRGYVGRALAAEAAAAGEARAEAGRLAGEAAAAAAAARRLAYEPFVVQAARDAATGAPLELPSVHFLCGHSFNLRDGAGAGGGGGDVGGGAGGGGLGGGGLEECPLCAPAHARARELAASGTRVAADADGFFKALRASGDGFATVAEFLGRGLMS
jgi:hypothetical protein